MHQNGAYGIAYKSILQTSRPLMFFDGYRPRGGEQHATVIELVEERLGTAHIDKVRLFDQMRQKRHRVIYKIAGLISKKEGEESIHDGRGEDVGGGGTVVPGGEVVRGELQKSRNSRLISGSLLVKFVGPILF